MENTITDLLELFISLVSNVGFPIMVAAFLLLRLEMKMEKLTAALMNLQETIRGLSGFSVEDRKI